MNTSTVRIEMFSKHSCQLGEGIFFDKNSGDLYWLDILERLVFSKKINSLSESYDRCWEIDAVPTAILPSKKNNHIVIVTDKWVGNFNVLTGNAEIVFELRLPSGFRTNDAGYDFDNNLWIGVMEKAPSGKNGYIDIYSKDKTLIHRLPEIGIPNTMVSDRNKTMLISDSYEKKMFRYLAYGDEYLNEVYMDLSGTEGTPDGGSLDGGGDLYFAVWGEGVIAVSNAKGHITRRHQLPVPFVSNCCFGGKNNEYLFVTSARDGMSDEELLLYPLSGCVFRIEL